MVFNPWSSHGCFVSDLELSEDDKYAAAYTNNYQIIILNTLISEFIIIENPFKHPQIQGDITWRMNSVKV